jgi:hypothetical protein
VRVNRETPQLFTGIHLLGSPSADKDQGEAPREPRRRDRRGDRPHSAPHVIIAGLPDVDSNLIIEGRTTALNRSQSESLWKVLRSPHPHAWPQWIGSGWTWPQ